MLQIRRNLGTFAITVSRRWSTLDDMSLRGKFTEHPASVNETYFEHFRKAASFSRQLGGAAVCCAIHALFPWTHCTTASSKIQELHTEMAAENRGAYASSIAP